MEALVTLRETIKNRFETSMNHRQIAAAITPEDQQGFRNIAEHMYPWLKTHDLTGTLDFLQATQSEILNEEPSIQDSINHLEMVPTVLRDELKRRIFLYVPPDDANLFNTPAASFSLTYTFFPSTRADIREAGRCYALGCYTASVYHSMAIAQAGLHLLADALSVSFDGYSLNLAEWNSVISGIEGKIKPMREGPRSDKKDDEISFYSECATQFRYFKDAWRNHVCHMREVYDRDQAHSILLHVRDFMEKLATRLKETETPVR
jgi:hypothetical protein